AEKTGAEDGCPTNSASAGIAITIAAIIAGTNILEIEALPFSNSSKREIILQRGHDIHYGANVRQMITLGGGIVKPVGAVNLVQDEHIRSAINENTAALFYVKSHHTVQKGMLSFREMLVIANEFELPLIVDGAAESDIHQFIKAGASAVIFSGNK